MMKGQVQLVESRDSPEELVRYCGKARRGLLPPSAELCRHVVLAGA
jgi:hypothetical protein